MMTDLQNGKVDDGDEGLKNLVDRSLDAAQLNDSGPKSSKSTKSPKNALPKAAIEKAVKSDSKPVLPLSTQTNGGDSSAKSRSGPSALPDFIIQRNKLFDELKQKHDAEMLQKERPEIEVILDLGFDKNGKARPQMPVAAKAWESTPGSFLRYVDKEISADVVIAKVDGKELWDLDRPLEYGCRIGYLPFTSSEGRNVFWHSSAHVLGEAAECQYNCLLSHGPPVEQGFFYDMAIADG